MSSSPQPAKPDVRVKAGGPPPPSGAYPVDSEIHVLDRIAVIYRYRAIAISVFVLTTLAVIIQSSTNIVLYSAHARILIEDERSTAVPGLNNESQYYEDPEPYYNTQYKILQGRDLARRVVTKLQLSTIPEFNGTAPTTGSWINVVRGFADRARGLFDRSQPAEQEAPAPGETPDESAYVDAFLGRLVIVPDRGTRLVDVGFRSTDAQFAARAANALAEEYVTQNLELKLRSTDNMLEWLGQELANQQKKVQEAESAMASYRDKQNAMSLDDKQNIVLSRLNKLNDDVVGAKTRKAQKEVLYNQIRTLTPAELGKASAIAQNVQVAAAQARVQEMQAERVRLSQRYGERHPDYLKAVANVQEAERVASSRSPVPHSRSRTITKQRFWKSKRTQNLNAAKRTRRTSARRASTTT